jgi:hypothetical protein
VQVTVDGDVVEQTFPHVAQFSGVETSVHVPPQQPSPATHCASAVQLAPVPSPPLELDEALDALDPELDEALDVPPAEPALDDALDVPPVEPALDVPLVEPAPPVPVALLPAACPPEPDAEPVTSYAGSTHEAATPTPIENVRATKRLRSTSIGRS